MYSEFYEVAKPNFTEYKLTQLREKPSLITKFFLGYQVLSVDHGEDRTRTRDVGSYPFIAGGFHTGGIFMTFRKECLKSCT